MHAEAAIARVHDDFSVITAGIIYNFCNVTTQKMREAERMAGGASGSYRILVSDREIALSAGIHIIGRSNEARIFVDDVGVSRQHARITIRDDRAVLEDLGSKNGTVLDGRAVDAPTPLVDGSLIVIGATALRFRIFISSTSTETVTRRR